MGFLDSFGIFHRCSVLWLIITTYLSIYIYINKHWPYCNGKAVSGICIVFRYEKMRRSISNVNLMVFEIWDKPEWKYFFLYMTATFLKDNPTNQKFVWLVLSFDLYAHIFWRTAELNLQILTNYRLLGKCIASLWMYISLKMVGLWF